MGTDVCKNFMEELERLRMELGISMQVLAERADISVRQYQNYLYGAAQPLFSTAMRMAAVVGMDLNRLLVTMHPDEFGVFRKPVKH